ncbi:hypothetical protein [Rhodoferax sp.]|uniref:hypothetical protein n=1 Tax=Rhodoferax sp. TaxID=50421 RepID=UPI00374D5092
MAEIKLICDASGAVKTGRYGVCSHSGAAGAEMLYKTLKSSSNHGTDDNGMISRAAALPTFEASQQRHVDWSCCVQHTIA